MKTQQVAKLEFNNFGQEKICQLVMVFALRSSLLEAQCVGILASSLQRQVKNFPNFHRSLIKLSLIVYIY